ncbi:hypothetical protein [Chitinophaga alhagiae]|uniref:hypothetical protein n=1 Tax=Chitinophaga alhagiae TaxID=2203219 RepID=UPI001300231C|nr:hypothetical protein [Chitinophaga alhagiae]
METTSKSQKAHDAIVLCIKALNSEAHVQDIDKKVLETVHELMKLPYEGRGLGIGAFGYKDYRSNWEDFSKRIGTSITDPLSWLNVMLLLYDLSNFDEQEMLESAQRITGDDIIFNHILKHIITNCVKLDNIKAAEQFIPHFRKTRIFKEEDNFDRGYLIILKYYALQGDPDNFFGYFKQSRPAINKSEVNEAKEILVERYTIKNGIEAALSLCAHKNLGEKYCFNALQAIADSGGYTELKGIFDKFPGLKQPETETELRILTQAWSKAKQQHVPVDDDYDSLFERIKNIDKKLRWGDFRLQDGLFLDLGMASNDNPVRVKQCKKAIKNASLKKELA